MEEKGKKINPNMTVMSQITLLLSKFLFLKLLVSGFSFISSASFIAYARILSLLRSVGLVFSCFLLPSASYCLFKYTHGKKKITKEIELSN